MKVSKFYFPLLAAGMLASCSSENDPVIDNGNSDGDVRYLAVNICNPSSTRAGVDGGFGTATAEEVKADKGLFILYKSDGTWFSQQEIALTTWDDGTQTPAVDKISQAVLVIGSTDKGVEKVEPSQIIVVLNPTEAITSAVKEQSLTTAISTISGDYGSHGDGTFIMSNSVYFDNTTKIDAAQIAGHVAKSQSEAMNNAVDIYVDRVVSKIVVDNKNIEITNNTVTIDGAEVTLIPDLDGIEIANVAKTSYLVKNITDISATWPGFNDYANKRTYWATIPSSMEYRNMTWNQYSNEGTLTEGSDKGSDWTKGGDYSFFVQENTDRNHATSLLISATLKKQGEDGAENAPFSFVKWAGQYYAASSFMTQIASNVKGAGFEIVARNDDGSVKSRRDIASSNFGWISNAEHTAAVKAGTIKAYETYAKVNTISLNEGEKIERNGEESNEAAINAFLAGKAQQVWLWNEGKCYYFVNIEHFGPENTYDLGVVRNHIYSLTLESLTGLGTPVFNPEEIIIPEKPVKDQFYVAARINILKWKMVTQKVNFKD